MTSKFNLAAQEVALRHTAAAKKIIACLYGAGNLLVLAIPPIKNGFVQTLFRMKPDMDIFVSSYSHRPLPIAASALLLLSSHAIWRGHFARGHAFIFGGDVLLCADFMSHQEMSSALSLAPSLLGSFFGTIYQPLERNYANADNWIFKQTIGQPKRLAGLLMTATSAPVIVSAYFNDNVALLAAGLTWFSGNVVSMMLPRDATPILPQQNSSPKKPVLSGPPL